MFLELISFLSSIDSGFNVLSYLTVRAVFAMMTALLITLVLGKWIISKLQHYQIGQVIRDDGPESHLEKQGTPTMGGVLILFAFFLSVIIWGDWNNPFLWIVVVTALLFSSIGFIDDYLKVIKKKEKGSTWIKKKDKKKKKDGSIDLSNAKEVDINNNGTIDALSLIHI